MKIKKYKFSLILVIISLILIIVSYAIIGKQKVLQKPINVPIIVVVVDNKPLTEKHVAPAYLTEGDNIAPQANITSSRDPFSGDFSIDKVVDGIKGEWGRGEWAVRGTQTPVTLKLDWGSLKRISKVKLYDRSNPYDDITSSKLRFRSGYEQDVGALPPNGAPRIIDFGLNSPHITSWLEFNILGVDSDTQNIGLSEIEVIEIVEHPRQVSYSTVSPERYLYRELIDGNINLVEQYCQDIANSGYMVILHPSITETTPQRLKTYLKNWRNFPNSSITRPDKRFFPPGLTVQALRSGNYKLEFEGAVLIGDLPIMRRDVMDALGGHNYSPFDFYFMDLDGRIWWNTISEDTITTTLDIYNQDTFSALIRNPSLLPKPEIWVSRISAHDLYNAEDKINRVKNYLRKNHDFRKYPILNGKALFYVDDYVNKMIKEYENPAGILSTGLQNLFSPLNIYNTTLSSNPTTGNDFLNRIGTSGTLTNNYTWLDLSSSGIVYVITFYSPLEETRNGRREIIAVREDDITTEDLGPVQPTPVYYVLRSSASFCNYLNDELLGALSNIVPQYPTFIGGVFIYSEYSRGLVCLGSALPDPYSWYRRAKIDFSPFYIGLSASRANFGRAYIKWLKSKAFWDVGNRIYEITRVFEFNLTGDAALPIYGNK